jgi:prepilin-type N-terminal cleavage/methylation domain-containing protein
MTNPRTGTARGGFTLIEVLVVIAIIGILVAVLAVAVSGLQRKAMWENTQAFVNTLEQGCLNYREKLGVGRDYPPMDQPGHSSRNLVYYLTRRFNRPLAQAGVVGINLPTVQDKPILVLEESRFNPSGAIIDFWERPIEYYNSGSGSGGDPFSSVPGHNVLYPNNPLHFDIVSLGPYETGSDPDGKDCRIATFKKQPQ